VETDPAPEAAGWMGGTALATPTAPARRASRLDLAQSRRETAAVSQQRDDLINRGAAAPPGATKEQENG
jgi:hypothetical protein